MIEKIVSLYRSVRLALRRLDSEDQQLLLGRLLANEVKKRERVESLGEVEFKVFSGAANMENGRVVGLRVPGGSEISRSEIDDGIFRKTFS